MRSVAGQRQFGRSFLIGVAAAILAVVTPATLMADDGEPPSESALQDDEREFDEVLLDVVEAVSEFGGFYLSDDSKVVNVWLRDGDDADARQARSELRRRFSDQIGEGVAVRAHQARYTWDQLQGWSASLQASLDAEGVVFIDIDDRINRLAIGVHNIADNGAAVRRQARELSVPEQAVVLVEAGPLEDLHHAGSITDWHRPVVGGLLVHVADSSQSSTNYVHRACTEGVVADRGGIRGHLTASHCTSTIGGPNDGSLIGQPNVLTGSGNGLGNEARDGQWWSSGCTTGRLCRYADTTWFNNTSGANNWRGRVAWPSSIGSLQWDGTTTRRINARLGTEPIVDATVALVGAVSGRQQGKVLRTCVAFNDTFPAARIPGSSTGEVRWRCQSTSDIPATLGDSGSMLFRRDSGDALDATAYGILMGQVSDGGVEVRVFAPMKNIMHSTEQGSTFRVCDTAFDC